MDYALEKRKLITPSKPKVNITKITNNTPRNSPAPTTTPIKQSTPVKTSTPHPTRDDTTQDDKKTQGAKKTHIYSEEEIRNLTSDGYIMVFPGLWDHIPKGAHIRFLKKDNGAGLSRGMRFKPGGFVRNHYVTDDGKKMMIIENKPSGKSGEFGYISFPLSYEDLEIIWKKYDHDAFIEIHLIYNSLAQKKQQIEELTSRVNRLENILRNAIKQ